jgi:hypothetical protein
MHLEHKCTFVCCLCVWYDCITSKIFVCNREWRQRNSIKFRTGFSLPEGEIRAGGFFCVLRSFYIGPGSHPHSCIIVSAASKILIIVFYVVTMSPAFTQPLTEMSNRDRNKKKIREVEGGRCVRLKTWPPSVSWLSRQCGILNITQPCRRPRPLTGIALLFIYRCCSYSTGNTPMGLDGLLRG